MNRGRDLEEKDLWEKRGIDPWRVFQWGEAAERLKLIRLRAGHDDDAYERRVLRNVSRKDLGLPNDYLDKYTDLSRISDQLKAAYDLAIQGDSFAIQNMAVIHFYGIDLNERGIGICKTPDVLQSINYAHRMPEAINPSGTMMTNVGSMYSSRDESERYPVNLKFIEEAAWLFRKAAETSQVHYAIGHLLHSSSLFNLSYSNAEHPAILFNVATALAFGKLAPPEAPHPNIVAPSPEQKARDDAKRTRIQNEMSKLINEKFSLFYGLYKKESPEAQDALLKFLDPFTRDKLSTRLRAMREEEISLGTQFPPVISQIVSASDEGSHIRITQEEQKDIFEKLSSELETRLRGQRFGEPILKKIKELKNGLNPGGESKRGVEEKDYLGVLTALIHDIDTAKVDAEKIDAEINKKSGILARTARFFGPSELGGFIRLCDNIVERNIPLGFLRAIRRGEVAPTARPEGP